MWGSLFSAAAATAGFLGAALVIAWLARRVFGQPPTARRAAVPQHAPRRSMADVATDLRRLTRQAQRVRPGEPMARRRALQAAYDDVLAEAADLLGIPHRLCGATGTARDGERLALEAGIEAAGLAIRA